MTRSYPDGTKFDEILIASGNASVTIDPAGAYVTSWNVNGKEILYIGSSKKRTGIPLLFPYFGTSKKGRQHGFGRDSLWKVENQSQAHVSLVLSDLYISDQAKKEFPHPFNVELSIEILSGSSFTYSLTVVNSSENPLPISPGLHPYWAINHSEKKSVKTNGIPGFDASVIDWENNPPDNDFTFEKRAEIITSDYKVVIEDISYTPSVRQMVIWSQNSQKPDYNFICFEPVCGIRGGIDSAPIFVESNKSWTMKLKFSAET